MKKAPVSKIGMSIVALTALVTLGAGIANATPVAASASAASSGFVGAAPADVGFIDHAVGRYVTNTDHNAAHSVAASLGIITGVTFVTGKIRAFHENANSGAITCWMVANDMNGLGFDSAPANTWNTLNQTLTQTFTINGLSAGARYALTAFCSIPPDRFAGGSKILGAWTE